MWVLKYYYYMVHPSTYRSNNWHSNVQKKKKRIRIEHTIFEFHTNVD